MKYFNISGPTEEYTCDDDSPPKFCADEDTYLDIKFSAGSSSTSLLILMLSATYTYRYQDYMTRVYIGVAIGVIICVAAVCVVLYILYRRRNLQGSPSVVMNYTTPVTQKQFVITEVPPIQPNIPTGQGTYPAHQATIVAPHSTPLSPPTYSELLTDETKRPLTG
ncbi:uncharacterized protein LOC117330528 [Pecten maximus]|uniref:uncharacterized protein LOC117330528 n=1 Tax=Pecten maximus TaxID=6579 RepID=UPI00145826DC|nr:uncharacterized protein LOC117330528 [Pecten maximus]XP_033744792.1 uncharacterized protein LOC117330528 [Pecten maximus]XP_033744793.1 uncharacterized protein LOC117330528 [Pecten maximus]XP_033744794.1 uncharacterized protein LOC117330528 [Pecten maximus]